MATHEQSRSPSNFERVLLETTTHELVGNDTKYQVGDVLYLRESEPHGSAPHEPSYSGRECFRRITSVQEGSQGLWRGYVLLGITPMDERT